MTSRPQHGQVFRLSTSIVPPKDRMPLWEATLAGFGCKLNFSRIEDEYEGRLSAQALGPLLTAELACSKLEARRTRLQAGQMSSNMVYIFQQVGRAGSFFGTDGFEPEFVAPGDLVIGDNDGCAESLTSSGFHHRLWMIPRQLANALNGIERGVRLRAADPMARMLQALLTEAERYGGSVDAAAANRVGLSIAHLTAAAAGAAAFEEPAREAVGVGQLSLVKRCVERRLCDPLLSPARIAAECGVSLRKLHALFEPTGVSFGQHVLKRRLARAHAQLSDPAQAARPITEVAFGLGFNSLSAFYRGYRDVYGEPPGDTRARALRTAIAA